MGAGGGADWLGLTSCQAVGKRCRDGGESGGLVILLPAVRRAEVRVKLIRVVSRVGIDELVVEL